MNWWDCLNKPHGSRPRCVALMDGPPQVVADRLMAVVNLPGLVISTSDLWMPRGKPYPLEDGSWHNRPAAEARLDNPNPLVPLQVQADLKNWWLFHTDRGNTPNWDIAATAHLDAEPCLLLVEAKAHVEELTAHGGNKLSSLNLENRQQIIQCLQEANADLARETGLRWQLSWDSCYQMSNRFAWAWKLTQLGYHVVLVYLGFLSAEEMVTTNTILHDTAHWEKVVHQYCQPMFPTSVWGQRWPMGEKSLTPLIRTTHQSFHDKPNKMTCPPKSGPP